MANAREDGHSYFKHPVTAAFEVFGVHADEAAVDFELFAFALDREVGEFVVVKVVFGAETEGFN